MVLCTAVMCSVYCVSYCIELMTEHILHQADDSVHRRLSLELTLQPQFEHVNRS